MKSHDWGSELASHCLGLTHHHYTQLGIHLCCDTLYVNNASSRTSSLKQASTITSSKKLLGETLWEHSSDARGMRTIVMDLTLLNLQMLVQKSCDTHMYTVVSQGVQAASVRKILLSTWFQLFGTVKLEGFPLYTKMLWHRLTCPWSISCKGQNEKCPMTSNNVSSSSTQHEQWQHHSLLKVNTD